MAGHPDRQVGNDPVGTVFRDQGNVAALGQLPGAQPVRGATGLVADFGPGQRFDLAASGRLNHEPLARVAGFTLVEHLQRQTKIGGHGMRSCFCSVSPQA